MTGKAKLEYIIVYMTCLTKNLIRSNLLTAETYLRCCSSTPWQQSNDKIHDKVIDSFRAWLLFLFHLQDKFH